MQLGNHYINIMKNYKMLISWIIIGRNWGETIIELIDSLNSQQINSKLIEFIIVDDASNDGSEKQFDRINVSNKKIIILKEHSGRIIAQNSGIEMAQGKYCLFTQSNVIPSKNFLSQYIEILYNSNIDGASGIINYTCEDNLFEKYLNHNKRGLKQFPKNSILPIQYVLFGNCAIKTKLLKEVKGFNKDLTGYGGEEIELLHRINKIKNLKILKIDALVVRVNHPELASHCNRLFEFGQTNFKHLPYSIQKKIIPSFFLKSYIALPISMIYSILFFIYKSFHINSFLLIRYLLGLSILKGYKN